MKVCKHCEIGKELTDFYKSKSSKGGYETKCKSCRNELSKKAKSIWLEKNKDKIKEYREKNKESLVKKNKIYRAKNKKKIQASKRKYYLENIDKIKAYNAVYYKTDSRREVLRLSNAKRRALKVSTEDGSITHESLKELLISQDFKCPYCEIDISVIVNKMSRHLDHIIPLSKGGTHTLDNVQYTCGDCNNRKYTKTDFGINKPSLGV